MGRHFLVNQSLSYVKSPYVEKNPFLTMQAEDTPLPTYEEAKGRLPRPIWEGHEDALACYDKAWEIAFRNLRRPVAEAGFVSNFIDSAFNGYLFMWDSSFIVMFGRYGSRVFNFQKTLDNFYSHQHKDGFICREICETEPGEQFQRDDPASTGPNILPWSEWEYYCLTGDKERLERVFYPLLAYHKWLQLHRTWRDGSYWACGLASGMDNQPRVQEGYSDHASHGHSIWLDACIQMVISGKILLEMGRILGHGEDTLWLEEEVTRLTALINETMWSEEDGFYYDLWRTGLSGVKSIGAYWSLLADIVPPARIPRLIAHLENPGEFKRPHRIPSLSADHPAYREEGCYWRGSVWAPTNYMVLRGLGRVGYGELAYEIGCNTLDNVVKVFLSTGTLWENYSSEHEKPGDPARPDFVGWTGLIPIAVLIEYVLGIGADADAHEIVWNVRRTERHGIERYPFEEGEVDLVCEARAARDEEPVISVHSKKPVRVRVIWDGGEKIIESK
ncbi:MAG: glycoside hydrolase [Clostridia bacterium]|nr:glycoside hydrolase [Clostridia bacterium]